jgi:hypothetical protein
MEFKHNWEFETEEEMTDMISGGVKKLHDLIVDEAIANLKTRTKSIPVVSIHTRDNGTIYDIMIERDEIIETLEQNLESMEYFEDYERCQQIVDAISYLKQNQ